MSKQISFMLSVGVKNVNPDELI